MLTRTNLETIKAELGLRYAEHLDQPSLSGASYTAAEKYLLCVGFENGVAWLCKVLETAGVKVSDE